MRKPVEIPTPTAEELEALETLYRTTRDVRLRTRAQMVLLAAEQRLTAPAIAKIVRAPSLTQTGSRRDKASARNPVQSSWDCFFRCVLAAPLEIIPRLEKLSRD